MPARAPPELTIRAAAADDAAPIAALIVRLADRFIVHACTPQGRDRFMAAHTSDEMRKRLAAGHRYHVAAAGAEIVGVVGIREPAHLYHLFVAEHRQRSGLGRRLWDLARAQTVAASDPEVITVNSSLHAVPVYERFGFVATEPVRDLGGVPGVPMQLRLRGR